MWMETALPIMLLWEPLMWGDEYRNILGVMLDDGKTAVSEFQGVTGWREDFITVRIDKLRYTDKDSIVIQFKKSTSNYGSSDIHILSVNADANEVEIIEEVTILDGGLILNSILCIKNGNDRRYDGHFDDSGR